MYEDPCSEQYGGMERVVSDTELPWPTILVEVKAQGRGFLGYNRSVWMELVAF